MDKSYLLDYQLLCSKLKTRDYSLPSRLPSHARLVFTGVFFSLYQWKQRMFDGNLATFEMVKRPDTVLVLAVTSDEKILVTRQQQPHKQQSFLSLPGGVKELGESYLQAGQRELLEETGFVSSDWRLWHIGNGNGRSDWHLVVWLALKCEQRAAQHLDAGEKIVVIKSSKREFAQFLCDTNFRDIELSTEIWRRARTVLDADMIWQVVVNNK